VRTTEEWLTGEYFVHTATYTWPTRPPRLPTVKFFVFLRNTSSGRVTLIHSSLRYHGLYFDINVDSSR